VKGDEARVEAAFATWLEDQGWTVRKQVDHVDIVATRDGSELRAEVKGDAGPDAGTAADILYGQLLRRMVDRTNVTYAVVGPTSGVKAMVRVPAFVRDRLNIKIFEVKASGEVAEVLPAMRM